MTTDLEANVQKILENLMSNLAGLGFEYGYGLPSTTTEPSTTTTTTTEPAIKGEHYKVANNGEPDSCYWE